MLNINVCEIPFVVVKTTGMLMNDICGDSVEKRAIVGSEKKT